jgi:hypothetical protein
MFVGHYGVGFALKRVDTAISLGILFLAVQFLDILWPIFVMLGLERFTIVPGLTAASPFLFQSYPLSHSLVAAFLWSLVALGLVQLQPLRGNKLLAGGVIAIGIFSHYILDLIVHIPDLPVTFTGSTKIGLGLWNYYWPSIGLEMLFLFGGLWIYLKSTKGITFGGKYGSIILAVFLAIMQVMSTLKAPPDNPRMIAGTSLLLNLAIAGIAFWLDRKRIPVALRDADNSSVYAKSPVKTSASKDCA